MPEPRESQPSGASGMPNASSPRPLALWALLALVALEALLLAVGTVYSLVSLVAGTATDAGTGMALVVVAIVVTIGLVVVTVGLSRGHRWARSGAITWQVLQGALGLGCFQGLLAEPVWGWALLLPALAALALAFVPSVVAATRS